MKKNNWNPKSSQRQPFFLARLKQKKILKKNTQKKPQKQIIFYIYNKKVFTVDSIVQQKTKYKNEKKHTDFPTLFVKKYRE